MDAKALIKLRKLQESRKTVNFAEGFNPGHKCPKMNIGKTKIKEKVFDLGENRTHFGLDYHQYFANLMLTYLEFALNLHGLPYFTPALFLDACNYEGGNTTRITHIKRITGIEIVKIMV